MRRHGVVVKRDGVLAVVRVECTKLTAQLKVRLVLMACVASPIIFAVTMRSQSSVPSDTLFGRAVKDSGFALPLVVLGFAGLWLLPVLASMVGGDLFSAEDRYGTWTTMLTRSRSRAEVFAGKTLTALVFSTVSVGVLAASSLAAGALVVGWQPLIDLSGTLLSPARAVPAIVFAWMSVLTPTLGFAAVAVLVSVATRSSVAGIGLPVLVGMAMQLYSLVDGPESIRRLLITSAFEAWHGLLTEPPAYGALVYGTMVSLTYLVASLAAAYTLLQRRDIGR